MASRGAPLGADTVRETLPRAGLGRAGPSVITPRAGRIGFGTSVTSGGIPGVGVNSSEKSATQSSVSPSATVK